MPELDPKPPPAPPPAREWIALDFETATSSKDSACAIGVALVRGGRVVRRRSRLLRPPGLRFDPINVSIHGIEPHQVRDAPTLGELWSTIAPWIEGRLVVAHNAGFDIGVLRATLDRYGLPYPRLSYLCTVTLARRSWPRLLNHKLDTVSRHLGVALDHHDAEDDAVACAEIALACCRAQGTDDLIEAARALRVVPGRVFRSGFKPPGRARRGRPARAVSHDHEPIDRA